ncbi:MAG: hypothetical protein U9O24_08685 [Campylobacterota bacterium]|nr:hypothetical protein [Campylobacterota bacterium]
MCLIVTIVMFGFAIQSFMQGQYSNGAIQLIIALGFLTLLVRNIYVANEHKKLTQQEGCSTSSCATPNWLNKLFKRKEK